jgi:hypothetical protein
VTELPREWSKNKKVVPAPMNDATNMWNCSRSSRREVALGKDWVRDRVSCGVTLHKLVKMRIITPAGNRTEDIHPVWSHNDNKKNKVLTTVAMKIK